MPTSIHWHGILLPTHMDGVPGLSYPGIAPGETFTYRFTVRQSGTYWYHSHTGFQEQTGLYGPLVVEPAGGERHPADRDYVVMLNDWTDEDPDDDLRHAQEAQRLLQFRRADRARIPPRRTANWACSRHWPSARMWNHMRMSPADLADVTGYTYTYLMNGHAPNGNWTGLFQPGEQVRLRFINGSAMSFFDVRIPGLKMTVVAADGQDVEPVTVDEFRIAVAETYDVIVEPRSDRAYTIFAQSMDRTGYARGTLAPRAGHAGRGAGDGPAARLAMVDMMGAMAMGGTHAARCHSTAWTAAMPMHGMTMALGQTPPHIMRAPNTARAWTCAWIIRATTSTTPASACATTAGAC